MQFQLSLNSAPLQKQILFSDKILLIGSCFTEHIAGRLEQHGLQVLQNPHGILFNPLSVCYSLRSYLNSKEYGEEDLFFLNELWNSWDHHSRFSDTDKKKALEQINKSQRQAASFIKDADWLIITMGSAFQYHLKEESRPVANNHRAPSQLFDKLLLGTDLIRSELEQALDLLFEMNPKIRVLFTISPVRHIRDGVVENNRSKARLIEAVHTICDRYEKAFYFPAYELVIDVLRDYRFYDIDLVHPNYAATEYVWEQFCKACIDGKALPVMEEIKEIRVAISHRPRFPETKAHQEFIRKYEEKLRQIGEQFPWLASQHL